MRVCRGLVAVALLVLAGVPARALADGEVAHPRLGEPAGSPPPARAPGDAARALPRTVAVCSDPARGCWVVSGAAECEAPARVIGGAGAGQPPASSVPISPRSRSRRAAASSRSGSSKGRSVNALGA